MSCSIILNTPQETKLAKSAGSKSGKHKSSLLRNKDIKIDPDFYNGSNESILENAIYAKFTQDKTNLKKMLVLTKPAKLVEYKRGVLAHYDVTMIHC